MAVTPLPRLGAWPSVDLEKAASREADLELIHPTPTEPLSCLRPGSSAAPRRRRSQCIQRRGSIVDRPQATECEILLEP